MEGNNYTVRDLWNHLFGDQTGFLATFTGKQSGKPNDLIGTSQRFFKYPEQIDEAAAYLQAESDRDRDAYFGGHLFKSATTRTKDNAADEVSALWVEADEAPYSIEPTAIVESSPGRFHYYYALSRALPAEDAEELNRRLAADIGGDSGWGLSKVLRVPGTMNYKRETPASVTCDIKGGAYDPDELARMVPEIARPVATDLNHSMAGPPVALNAMEREVYEGKQPKLKEDGSVDRSASLMKIGRTLYNAGAERPAVVGALQERDEALYGGKYAERPGEYHRIFSKLEQEGRQGRFVPGPRRKLSPMMNDLQGLFAERLAAQNFQLTDMGNADRFDHLFGDDYIYIPAWRKFLVWEGTHWAEDVRGKMGQLVERMVRMILLEAAQIEDKKVRDRLIAHAKSSQQTARIKAVLDILKHRRTAAPEDLNTDHYLLNCQNGTLDLRADVPDEQRLRPHRRADLITKLVSVEYHPKAKAPLWGKMLRRVLPNVVVRDYVQRALGNAVTGDASHQHLYVPYGSGANGKNTILDAVLDVLGPYAVVPAPELLLAKKGAHPTEIADLFGARFALSSEVNEGSRFDVAKVKRLTGDKYRTARRMREDNWTFPRTDKIFMPVNHKPEIRDTTNSIWRRVKLIPFDVIIPEEEQDRHLNQKLQAELPGILAWLVRGCLRWQRDGLKEPEEVTKATETYRQEQDIIQAFFDECCVITPSAQVRKGFLFRAYQDWCEESREYALGKRKFGEKLRERNFAEGKDGDGNHVWKGIGLLGAPTPPEGPSGEHNGSPVSSSAHPETDVTDVSDKEMTMNGYNGQSHETIGNSTSEKAVTSVVCTTVETADLEEPVDTRRDPKYTPSTGPTAYTSAKTRGSTDKNTGPATGPTGYFLQQENQMQDRWDRLCEEAQNRTEKDLRLGEDKLVDDFPDIPF